MRGRNVEGTNGVPTMGGCDVSHPQGQATLLALWAVAIAVAMMVGAAQLGARLVARGRAAAAADAAALAAVDGGRLEAEQMAHRNGATLVRLEVLGDDVLVEVSVGQVVARARASRAP